MAYTSDQDIVSRAKSFLARYQFTPDITEMLARIYLDRIRLRRAKDFAGADFIRTHLMNLGVNVQLADDEILQRGPVKV